MKIWARTSPSNLLAMTSRLHCKGRDEPENVSTHVHLICASFRQDNYLVRSIYFLGESHLKSAGKNKNKQIKSMGLFKPQ